jgi:hypothetical protein
MSYLPALKKVLEYQQQVQRVHPLFGHTYPIAIVEGDTFLVFDVDEAGHAYNLVIRAPTPMPIPAGVRAAFDLECYKDQTSCVVSGDAFDTLDGYVTIFHEFVHCYQARTCEMELKQSLEMARQAMAVGNFMWELEHPFPYNDPKFIETYHALLQAVQTDDGEGVLLTHRQLKAFLQPANFEYIVWQEWKEGFARLIENRIQRLFNLPENHYGCQPPYHRITLYEGGAGVIAALSQDTPEIVNDLVQLFWRIYQTNGLKL